MSQVLSDAVDTAIDLAERRAPILIEEALCRNGGILTRGIVWQFMPTFEATFVDLKQKLRSLSKQCTQFARLKYRKWTLKQWLPRTTTEMRSFFIQAMESEEVPNAAGQDTVDSNDDATVSAPNANNDLIS